MTVTNESTLKELVDETGLIKNELVSCKDNLKNNLINLDISIDGNEKLSYLISKVKDVKSLVPTLPKWYKYDPYSMYPIKCTSVGKPSSNFGASPHIFYDESQQKIYAYGMVQYSDASYFNHYYAFEYNVQSNTYTNPQVTLGSGVRGDARASRLTSWWHNKCIYTILQDSNSIYKYDTTTRAVESLPWKVDYKRLNSITNTGGKYYGMGVESATFSEFNPETLVITQKPTRPSLTSEGYTTQDNIIGAMGDKVYSMGGSYYNSNFVIKDDEGLYVYDVKTDVWTLISYFLRCRCRYNNTIRAWNIDRGLMCIQVSSSIYMFDTKTNTYSFVKTLGKGYYYSTFCMTDKFAYLYSGKDDSSSSRGTSYDELWCQYLEVPYKPI